MSWLTTETIITKIERNANDKTKQAFHGVCPIDKLPRFIPHYPFFVVVNTHTHNLKGEHWIVILIDKDKRGELFDSLALPVSNFINRWMNTFSRKWKTNTIAYQHPKSATCGAFVIFYVLKRLSYKDFPTFKTVFTSKLYKNEITVLSFYNKLK